MNITKKELRKLIRETISDSYDTPVNGLTGLMQEYDVPLNSRKKLSKTLLAVANESGGPLDAAYEVSQTLKIKDLSEEFYTQAFSLIRDENILTSESKTVRISRRQIGLILKESLNDTGKPVLTEAELNEIAPFIAALKNFGKAILALPFKGAYAVAGKLAKDPKVQQMVMPMLKKAADKLPNVKKYIDAAGIDLKNPNFDEISKMFSNEKLKGELDKMLKQGGEELKKAEECDCPSLEDLQKAAS